MPFASILQLALMHSTIFKAASALQACGGLGRGRGGGVVKEKASIILKVDCKARVTMQSWWQHILGKRVKKLIEYSTTRGNGQGYKAQQRC